MEKEDLKLQNLLDADVPNEGQVGLQVDHVLAARGRLEREFTMMNLDLRKVLSVAQWRQLKTIRDERGPAGSSLLLQTNASRDLRSSSASASGTRCELLPPLPDPPPENF